MNCDPEGTSQLYTCIFLELLAGDWVYTVSN